MYQLSIALDSVIVIIVVVCCISIVILIEGIGLALNVIIDWNHSIFEQATLLYRHCQRMEATCVRRSTE